MARCWERAGTRRTVPVAELIVHLLVPAGVLAVALAAGPAAPAGAHARVSGSSPADGEVVATPPAEVRLDLVAKPGTVEGDPLQVYAPGGRRVDTGGTAVSADRQTLTVRLDHTQDLPAGEYQIMYRVVSADTHLISGRITFTADSASAGDGSRVAGRDGSDAPEALVGSAGASHADQPPSGRAADAPHLAAGGDDTARTIATAGAAGALVVLAVGWRLQRRRSRRSFEAELAELSPPGTPDRRPDHAVAGVTAPHAPAGWPVPAATTRAPRRSSPRAQAPDVRRQRTHPRGARHGRAVR